MGLIHLIDPKTKKPIRKKVLFVKSGAVVVVRIQVGTHPVLLLLMGGWLKETGSLQLCRSAFDVLLESRCSDDSTF